MVGRLVECKKIVRLEDEFGHCKACTLTAAEYSDLLVDVLTLEKEGSENVAKLESDVAHRYAVKGSEHSVFLVQNVLLILSIVAYIYIVTHLSTTLLRIQLIHNHPHKSGLSFAVPSYESHFFTSAHFDLCIREHYLLAVAHLQVHALKGDIPRTWSRRKLNCKCRLVFYVHLYPLKLLKLLYPGLYLVRLGRLVAESFNELLSLLYHPLLVLIGCLLLRKAFLPEFQVLAIRNLIVVDPSDHNLDCPVGHVVEELSVV